MAFNKFLSFYNSASQEAKNKYLNHYDFHNDIKFINRNRPSGVLKPVVKRQQIKFKFILFKKFFYVPPCTPVDNSIGYARCTLGGKRFRLPIYGPQPSPCKYTRGEYMRLQKVKHMSMRELTAYSIALADGKRQHFNEGYLVNEMKRRMEKISKKRTSKLNEALSSKMKYSSFNKNSFDLLGEECTECTLNLNYNVKESDSIFIWTRKQKLDKEEIPYVRDYCPDVDDYKIHPLAPILREKIYNLYLSRSSYYIRYNKLFYVNKLEKYVNKIVSLVNNYKNNVDRIVPQMDNQKQDASGSDVCPVEKHDSNVAVLDNRLESTDSGPCITRSQLFSHLSSAEQSQAYSELMDRPMIHDVFSWSVTKPRNTVLATYEYPRDFIVKHESAPVTAVITNYALMDMDCKVIIRCNTNKFMHGFLQATVYYSAIHDASYELRNNVYSGSQQHNCVISASSSNVGVLEIPFRYYKPKVSIKARADDPQNLTIARITIRVLNELTVTSNTYNSVNVTVSYQFTRAQFSGMLPKDLGTIKPEMMQAFAVQQIMKMLDQHNADPNRDNPPDYRPANSIVPSSAHSWCVGDNLAEPLQTLRLSGTGQTPHPGDTAICDDEMSVDYVKRIKSLIYTFEWDFNAGVGQILFECDIHPMFNLNYSFGHGTDSTIADIYNMSAIECLARLFTYFHGMPNYHFQIACTSFHTGRIIVAAVPWVLNKPTFEQVKGCPHLIFDLQGDIREFTFEPPQILDCPSWPTSRDDVTILPPSKLYVMVVNELVPMDSIASKIQFNLYISGERMEFYIPKALDVGLSTYSRKIMSATPKSVTMSVTFSLEIGDYDNFGNGDYYIWRYNSLPGEICTLNGAVTKTVYMIDIKKTGFDIMVGPNKVDYSAYGVYAVLIPYLTEYGACAFFTTTAQAKKYAASGKDSDAMKDEGRIAVTRVNGDWGASTIYWKVSSSSEWEIVEPNNERFGANGCAVNLSPNVPGTNHGMLLYGEKFDSLKTVCRRYQLYSHCSFKYDSKRCGRMHQYALRMRPQGFVDLTDDYLKSNRDVDVTREGHIPFVLSAYRMFRGGINVRIVVQTDCTFRVEMRCDESDEISIHNMSIHRTMFNDNYAYIVQDTKINRIVEFSIPWYRRGMLGLLQKPVIKGNMEASHCSLGTLYFGLYGTYTETKTIKFAVYYKLSDDFHASCFQGFPPMLKCPDYPVDDFENGDIIPQMGIFDLLDKKETTQVVTSVTKSTNEISEAATSIKETSKTANTLLKKIQTKYDSYLGDDSAIHNWINSITAGLPAAMAAIISSAVFHIIHVIATPTLTTVCVSLAAIVISIGLVASSWMWKLVIKFKNYFKRFFDKAPPASCAPVASTSGLPNLHAEQIQVPTVSSDTVPPVQTQIEEETVVPQMSDEQPSIEEKREKAGLLGTMTAGIMAALNITSKPPKTIPDVTAGLWNNGGKFAWTANALTRFFEYNLNWMTKLYRWIISKFRPTEALAQELLDQDDNFKALISRIQVLLDPANRSRVESDIMWTMQVYRLANYAQLWQAKFCRPGNDSYTPVIDRLFSKIIMLKEELVKAKISPPVRLQPLVICIEGESNIGKSHMITHLGTDLLKSINYKTRGELIYTRTPGNAYWNGANTQPICVFDDFLALKGEPGLQQMGELFNLKTTAVFNPPKAEIEEKNVRYNPLLVMLATNTAFPKPTEVMDEKALWRRRDFMIKAKPNEAFYNRYNCNPKSSSPNDLIKAGAKLDKFDHLLFGIYPSVIDSQAIPVDYMNYDELLRIMRNAFTFHYRKEVNTFATNMTRYASFLPNIEEENDTVAELIHKLDLKLLAENNIPNDEYEEINAYVELMLRQSASCIEGARSSLKYHINTIKRKDPELGNMYMDMFNAKLKVLSAEDVVGQVGDAEVVCIHKKLVPDMEYKRIALHGTPLGVFYDVMVPPEKQEFIPEESCEGICIFKDPVVKSTFMTMWMGNLPNRKIAYDNGDSQHTPEYFCSMRNAAGGAANCVYIGNVVDKETQSLFSWCKTKISSITSTILSIIKYVLLALGSLSAFLSMLSFMGYAKIESKITPVERKTGTTFKNITTRIADLADKHRQVAAEPQVFASGDHKTFGLSRPATSAKPHITKIIGNMASEYHLAVFQRISRNCMFIQMTAGNSVIYGRILGLVDHYALGVAHYNDEFNLHRHDGLFRVIDSRSKSKGGYNLEISWNDVEIYNFNNSALCIYKLPIQIPAFKNITSFIARADAHMYTPPNCELVEIDKSDGSMIVYPVEVNRIEQISVSSDANIQPFVVPDGYRYGKGGKGMCGSVLLSNNQYGPIIGMHVAGTTNGHVGYSNLITREQFQFLVDKALVKDIIEPNILLEYYPGNIAPESTVQVVGMVPSELRHREGEKSSVIPTECSGEIFPRYCDLPVLSKKDPRISENPYSPLQEGINKHGLVTLNFPKEWLDVIAEDLQNKILAKVKPLRQNIGKVSKQIAIVGEPNLPSYDKLDFNTSEGFPFSSYRPLGKKGKAWLFDLVEDQNGYTLRGINQDLRDVMKTKKLQRLRGALPFTVFTDCLKDRKLPIAKCTVPGKVRIFSTSPIDYTIQVRQYFLDFTTAWQEARFDVEHAVGIDVNSIEWTDLAISLLSKGNNIVTADYSGYGPSLNLACCEKVFEIINKWYKHHGDENSGHEITRAILGREAMHSLHLSVRTIYRTMCGLPSGGPLTVVGNSLVGNLYIRFAWCILYTNNINFKKISCTVLKSFHDNVVFYVYGDDVIISVNNLFIGIFNCKTIADVLNKYKIVVQNTTKGADIVECLPLLHPETTFLKNEFVPHPYRKGIFLAKLEKASVEDTCNWTFKNWAYCIRLASTSACEAGLRNAFGHGPDYFNSCRDKILSYWLKKGQFLVLPTWHEIDKNNYSS